MFGGMSARKKAIVKNIGYLFIWGDLYRVWWGVHALAVGPIDLGTHLQKYLSVFLPAFEWIASLSSFTNTAIEMAFGLPAVVAYFGGFVFSTVIGILLVRSVKSDQ